MDYTAVRVSVPTRERLKGLAGDVSIDKYLNTILDKHKLGTEEDISSIRGSFTFADVKRSIDALRHSFEARMDAQDKRIETLTRYVNRAISFSNDQNERLLCLENGWNIEEKQAEYDEWLWTIPEYKAEMEKAMESDDILVPLNVQVPGFHNWLVTQIVEREENEN